jgi:hypothetical protein
VRVAVQASLGVAIGRFITGEVPDDQGFVAAGREEHVRARWRVSISSTATRIGTYLALTFPGTWPRK